MAVPSSIQRWYEMVSLWIMNPTVTDRRHYFILEDTDDFDSVSRSLTSLGFRMSNNDSGTYSTDTLQIKIQEVPPGVNESYIGGCIYPQGRISQRIRNLLSLLKSCGRLFFGFIALYGLLWVLAFIVAITYSLEAVGIFGLPIGISILLGLVNACFTAILGILIDYYATRQNFKMISDLYPRFISSLEHFFPDILTHPITIQTSIGSRDIWKRLPGDFKKKIEVLRFGKVNEFFWTTY